MKLTILLEKYIPRICAWLIPVVVLLSIFILRPHWGLMDDVTNLFYMVPRMRETGIFRFGWIYGVGDLGWGMFRPTYPPMVYLIYVPGMSTASWVTFAWNALIVFSVIWLYSIVLARILKISIFPILLGSAAFFYGHDLLQHPSLQEKMILLAGAGLTWHCWNRERWKAWSFWIVALAWIFFGACVKASFAIHYCVAFMAYLAAMAPGLKKGESRAWVESFLLMALGIGMVLAFAYISSHGGYTRQYSAGKIIPNLLSVHGALFLVPILAALVWIAANWSTVWESPELLMPLAGVSAFLVLFLPWGIQGYVQSVITPLYAALIVQLGFWYLKKIPAGIWLSLLAIFAVMVSSYRSYINFGRLHDIGAIVANAAGLERAGATELWMPCNEGSLSMDRFFHESGSAITVKEQMPNMSARGKVLLYDQAMCPLPGRTALPADCLNPESIQPGLFPKSYQVLRCH